MAPPITSPMAKTPGTLVRKPESTLTKPCASVSTPIPARPRPWVRGRRPTDTRTTSALRVSDLPPSTGSTESVTPVFDALAPVTLVDSLNSIPCLARMRCI